MASGLYFPISAIPFSILVIILFFSKDVIKTTETKIYKYLIIVNFFGLIIEVLCTYASYISMIEPLLSDIILKSYLVYNTAWTLLLTIYVFYVSYGNNYLKYKIKVKSLSVLLLLITAIVTFVLRCDLVIKDNFNVRYTEGPSVNFTYSVCGILIFLIIVMIFMNKKNINTKKLIPVYIFIVTLIIGIVIQKSMPGLLIMTYIETLTLSIMYHTIENPDLKMLNELYKNRELMEAIYEDKYNFLFEMTQEARNPIKNISLVCNDIKNSDNIESIKENVDRLGSLTRQLDFSINDVLNISSMDIQKIKVVETKYDVLKVCETLAMNISDNKKENVSFNMDLPKQIPMLYGDYMKLRQILYSLLNNACKKTEEGSISLKLNAIEKYDVCRLIFNISDSGPGMSLDVINDILGVTGELNQEELKDLENKECSIVVCKKIARILGGNLMIKSTTGQGTDIVLTLDQRVCHDEESVLDKYKNELSNSKHVLIVSQDKRLINTLKNKMSSANIISSVLYYGGDVTDRIKSGKKYDFILVDDEMREMSGFDTFKTLRKLDSETPVAIMLKGDKERLKKHYLEDGFDDCLLVSNINNEINRLINKY